MGRCSLRGPIAYRLWSMLKKMNGQILGPIGFFLCFKNEDAVRMMAQGARKNPTPSAYLKATGAVKFGFNIWVEPR